jgi:hypothetical protein
MALLSGCRERLPCHVEGRARQCTTLQGCGRSGKSFLVSLRGVLQLVRTPACHAGGPPAHFTRCQAADTARWAR